MKKGFTLIEVLVVATIIAILAAVGMISYREFVKQSRDARRKTDIEQVRAAIEMYKSFNNQYPPTIDFATPGSIVDASSRTYMSKVPQDPQNTTYTYYYSTTAPYLDYTLCAYLETGTGSVAGTNCGGTTLCNYCMGPYGQK